MDIFSLPPGTIYFFNSIGPLYRPLPTDPLCSGVPSNDNAVPITTRERTPSLEELKQASRRFHESAAAFQQRLDNLLASTALLIDTASTPHLKRALLTQFQKHVTSTPFVSRDDTKAIVEQFLTTQRLRIEASELPPQVPATPPLRTSSPLIESLEHLTKSTT